MKKQSPLKAEGNCPRVDGVLSHQSSDSGWRLKVERQKYASHDKGKRMRWDIHQFAA
jgi:hypothetical protein